jgi:hypothetical protein
VEHEQVEQQHGHDERGHRAPGKQRHVHEKLSSGWSFRFE